MDTCLPCTINGKKKKKKPNNKCYQFCIRLTSLIVDVAVADSDAPLPSPPCRGSGQSPRNSLAFSYHVYSGNRTRYGGCWTAGTGVEPIQHSCSRSDGGPRPPPTLHTGGRPTPEQQCTSWYNILTHCARFWGGSAILRIFRRRRVLSVHGSTGGLLTSSEGLSLPTTAQQCTCEIMSLIVAYHTRGQLLRIVGEGK